MKRNLFLLLLTIGLTIGPFGNMVAAQTVKKVVVDPGHGGWDSGAVGNGLLEKDLTLKISRKVNQNLVNNYVVDTRMTRDSDVYLSLKQRTDFANNWGANLFLSIHINASGGSGYEDYIHNKTATPEDKKVQAEINKEINKILIEYNKKNRGQKQANFHVLRESKMASILLEILFIDNKSDAQLLKNEKFLNDISEAISTGVGNALALPKKGSNVVGTSNPNNSAIEKVNISKATGTYIVTANSLNVRTGDGTSYPTIGSLKKNEQINVTGVTSKKWYQFSYKGKTGYVSGAYLKVKPAVPKPAPKPAAKPKSDPFKVTKASGTYIVTANSLNVRTGNSTKYSSLGSLKKNNQVNVTGKTSNNWYQIKFKGKTGYVSGAYLRAKPVAAKPAPKPASKPAAKPKSAPAKASKVSGTYIVTASSLNVRTGNSTKHSSLGSLKKNNQVSVTGKTSNNWYQIKYKGKTGYISGAYLKMKAV
ncbi:N-acetylmuramoyl-L-alanine amidase [Siminovitchia acidinfaciens]|uniref:N-acetylmuramoyl-L-alanine amidase n=1 Tax=Siminovitchia acidinfaciens TaxID=2321395 RepID=A0A429XZJ7_9BACI|nr:N-acetylmuramoyl-L-alanine amidase [Siminovitchia acidinfaciens]RST74218.1 N-acetylmuramoyl-L-alanine amidase [Siminovitchia acidinfaciens]